MSKYEKLANYLCGLADQQVSMTFADVEKVLESKLPPVAYSSNAFWANSRTNDSHTWAHLWQGAGWQTSNVDIPGQKLVFIKTGTANPKLTPKQLRILQHLSSATGWTTRKQMEDSAGPKGFSKALGAPTHGAPRAGTLEALGLVERADGPPPFSYRITALGRATAARLGKSQAATSPAHTALVLTENELYAGQDFGWKDQTGEQYQFPNRYKSLVVPGETFVYYRGKRRSDGPAVPEYYGHGVIGQVQLSPGSEGVPAGKRKWTAQIAHWAPFDEPVPFRTDDGTYIETGTDTVHWNYWRDGVRKITRAHFLDILLSGGANPEKGEPSSQLIEDSGQLQEADKSLITVVKRAKGSRSETGNGKTPPRRSKQATVIGRAAEKMFYEFLLANARKDDRAKIRWVANEGITPGYDIQDDRDPKGIAAYEVKGTTASSFASVEITSNELRCAEQLGPRYALVLIIGVGSAAPRFQVVQNVSKLIEDKLATATPTMFSMTFETT